MNRKISIGIKMILFSLVGISIISSCIKDDIEPCKLKISFSYSYNMLSSNALANQADLLRLYIFDKKDILVGQYDIQRSSSNDNFNIEIDTPETGEYSFAVWAKSNSSTNPEADFEIPNLTVEKSTIDDLNYLMKRNEGIRKEALNNFLVGFTKANIQQSAGTQSVEISLKKVTKKIRLVLLPYSGSSNPIDVNNYEFYIKDDVGNGHVNYDYSLLPDQPIIYYPYYKANITPKEGEIPLPGDIDRAIAVEISTSRIMEAHQARLYVTSKSDKHVIADINLPWIFSLTEMEEHKEWSLQEYLDRQDEYVITLFIDGNTWNSSTIVINGWVVNLVEIDK